MNNQLLLSLLSGFIGSFIGIVATIFIYFIDKKRERINSAKIIYLQLYQAHSKFRESFENSKEDYSKVRQVYLDPNWYNHIIKLSPVISTKQMLDLCNYFEQLNNLFKVVKEYEFFIDNNDETKALEFKKKAFDISTAEVFMNKLLYENLVVTVRNISESKLISRKSIFIILLTICLLIFVLIIIS